MISGWLRLEKTGPAEPVGIRMFVFVAEELDVALAFRVIKADMLNMSNRNIGVELAIELREDAEQKLASGELGEAALVADEMQAFR